MCFRKVIRNSYYNRELFKIVPQIQINQVSNNSFWSIKQRFVQEHIILILFSWKLKV